MTERLIGTAVVLAVVIVLYWSSLWLGRRFVKRVMGRDPDSGARAQTMWRVIRRVIVVVLFALALMLGFQVWEVGLAPFIAVGTVLAAAIGFGAQDFVKDLLSGFFILAEDQYRIGDTVTITGTTGTVEDIQLRVTVLRDLEGNVHFVPNGSIVVSSNFTSQYAQPVIDVGVSYDTDIDFALEILEDELARLASDPEWSERIKGPAEVLGVNELDGSAVIIRGRLTTVAEERWSVRREALRRLKKRFDAEGIVIPFPQLTIHQRLPEE
jgi:small conductance mechanosensitive channel